MPNEGDEVTVRVPDADFRAPSGMASYYSLAQTLLAESIERNGLASGVSVVLSGITRQMRRHMTVEQVAEALRGFADTVGDARKFDEP